MSPSPGCSPRNAASRIGSSSRCCSAWPPARRMRSSARWAGCCSTHPWFARANSTSRLRTSSAVWKRTRARTTSCPPCSNSTATRPCSTASASGSSPRCRASLRAHRLRTARRTAPRRPLQRRRTASITNQTPTRPSRPTAPGGAPSCPGRRLRPSAWTRSRRRQSRMPKPWSARSRRQRRPARPGVRCPRASARASFTVQDRNSRPAAASCSK